MQRLGLGPATTQRGQPARHLAPKTINRIPAAVSVFHGIYDRRWFISGRESSGENPGSHKAACDRAASVLFAWDPSPDPSVDAWECTAEGLPRPLAEDQVSALLAVWWCTRDLALVRLMLDGGLRPGEVPRPSGALPMAAAA